MSLLENGVSSRPCRRYLDISIELLKEAGKRIRGGRGCSHIGNFDVSDRSFGTKLKLQRVRESTDAVLADKV